MIFVALIFSFFWFTQKSVEDPCSRQPAGTEIAGENNLCKIKLGAGKHPEPPTATSSDMISIYLKRDFTTVAERLEYIAYAENSRPEDGNLFFCFELSILRELNERYKDKNFNTSMSNKYKEILTALGLQLVNKWNIRDRTFKYSDYKSYQGVYADFRHKEKSLEQFQKDKDLAFAAANKLFSDYLISNGIISANEKPEDWFRAGIGFSADEASISARVSRYLTSPNRLRVFSSREIQEALADVLHWESHYREEVLKDFAGTDLVFTTTNGVLIPHLEVFELLRKYEDPVDFKKALVEAFSGLDQKKAQYLERKLDAAVMERLQIYKSLIDTFSPALMMAERNIASLEPADFGGMSADFAGLGALNLHAVAEALAQSRGNVSEALVRARAAEVAVTKLFRKRLAEFKAIVQLYFPHMTDSGDDFIAFGDVVLSLANKKRLLNELAEYTRDSKKRIAFLSPGANKKERNLIVAHGEAIEKELRLILKGKMSQEKLSQLLFGIDMITQTAGTGIVQTLVGIPKTLTLNSSDWTLILQSSKEAIEKVNSTGTLNKKVQYRTL